MRHTWIVAVAIAGMLCITGQAFAYKKVKCFILQTPTQALPGVKRIAILDFEGPGGRDASDQLISALLQDKRGIYSIAESGLFGLGASSREGRTYQVWATTKIFDIVERSMLERVLQEQKLGMTGIIDDSQAAALGKVLGVNAIITGVVSYESNDSRLTEKRTKYRSKEEGGGSYEISVECSERKVTGPMKMRVISVETGQILGNRELSLYNSDKKCADQERGALASTQTLLRGAIDYTASAMASYISPYFALVEMELEKVKANQYKDKADDAAKLAEKGQLGQAYLLYYGIYQEDQYNPEILYNLGILNEAVGNFADAKTMYETALSLKSDEKEYQTALARVDKSVSFTDVLKTLGIPVTVYEWKASASAVAEAVAEKIAVKGARENRQDVKQEAKADSPVVAKVPGGVELVVLAKEGDWFKVKLPGGKEGYLHRSQVKE